MWPHPTTLDLKQLENCVVGYTPPSTCKHHGTWQHTTWNLTVDCITSAPLLRHLGCLLKCYCVLLLVSVQVWSNGKMFSWWICWLWVGTSGWFNSKNGSLLGRSGLTMPLSRHSVGTYQETSSHATRQGTLGHSRLSSLSHCGLILA